MLAVPPDFPNQRNAVRALKLDNGEDRKRLPTRRAFSVSTQEGIRRANTEALLQPRGALSGGGAPSTYSVNVKRSIVPILREAGADVKNQGCSENCLYTKLSSPPYAASDSPLPK